MQSKTKQQLAESAPLLLMLATVLVVHVAAALGVELPFTADTLPARLERDARLSAGIALFAVLASLWLLRVDPSRRRARRTIGFVILAAGVAFYVLVSMLGGNVLVMLGLTLVLRPGIGGQATPDARRVTPANPRVSPLAIALPICAALVATSVTSKARFGHYIPQAAPEERVLRAGRYVSAAAVAMSPAGQVPRALSVQPDSSRAELLRQCRRQGGGFTVARVLDRLDSQGALEGLPRTDAALAQALLEPALASGLLVSPEGRSLAGSDLWGVVIEAESRTGRRRAFLSLGVAPPSGQPAPRYQLLFEAPEGAAPVVIGMERDFPTSSGFEGIALPGVFLLYLLAFLVAAVVVSWWVASRRSTRDLLGGRAA